MTADPRLVLLFLFALGGTADSLSAEANGHQLVVASHAGPAAPARVDLSEEQLRLAWQQRYRDARKRVTEARKRVAESVNQYRLMRHRQHARGKAKAQIEDELLAARSELEAAEEELAALPELARRAGVLPGWLRELEDEDR